MFCTEFCVIMKQYQVHPNIMKCTKTLVDDGGGIKTADEEERGGGGEGEPVWPVKRGQFMRRDER